MAGYGFKDRKKAEQLRDFAAEFLPLRKGEQNGRYLPVDNGSRIYAVRLNADLPAATVVDGVLTPGVVTCTVFEVPSRNPAEAATPRGGASPLTRDVYNLRQRKIPAEPSLWYPAVEDSFGALLLVEDGKPDMHGTLAAPMTGGQTTTTTVTLANGQTWMGLGTLDCLPAPNIPDDVAFEADEKVLCHWMDSVGEGGAWVAIPFRRGGGECHVMATPGSGNAAVGFETALEYPRLFARTLAMAAHPTQEVLAKIESVEVTGDDSGTVWYKHPGDVTFPNHPFFADITTPVWTDGTRVQDGFSLSADIIPTVSIDGATCTVCWDACNGKVWFSCGQKKIYYGAYSVNGDESEGWILMDDRTVVTGYVPLETSYLDANSQAVYGGDAFWVGAIPSIVGQSATFSARGSSRGGNDKTVTTVWSRYYGNHTFGEYVDTDDSTSKIYFGLPRWKCKSPTSPRGMDVYWVRSLVTTGGYYGYEGSVTVKTQYGNTIDNITKTYSGLSRQRLSIHHSYFWCIGTIGDSWGWWQCADEPDKAIDRVFVFTVPEQYDKEISWDDVIQARNTSEIIRRFSTNDNVLYYVIDDTLPRITWWQATVAEMEQHVTFAFARPTPPEGEEPIASRPDVSVSFGRYLQRSQHVYDSYGNDLGAITFRAATGDGDVDRWVIGTYDGPNGWWETTDSEAMKTAVTFVFTHRNYSDITLQFVDYVQGENTRKVLAAQMEIWEA
ncbi:MAG: hypothetical protein Q4D98_03590 [Planctomycetia bacterium]|nr:hypothetical protein [Planctomycetia bacterium]